jgi:GTP pyrophosphokinase
LNAPPPEIDPRVKARKPSDKKAQKDSIVVEGVGNLLSQLAKCCQPLPGDQIQGYITQGRGVSVHRQDCDQLLHLLDTHPERLIDVKWASELVGAFQTQIDVFCLDRDGILRDITTILANEKIALLGVNSLSDTGDHTAKIKLSVEVKDLNSLSRTIIRLQQIKGVSEVNRQDHS